MFLEGKRALVTGSTSGIGLAIARALAAEGAEVVLNGFGDADEIAKLCAELGATHSGADLTDVAQIEAMMADSGGMKLVEVSPKPLGVTLPAAFCRRPSIRIRVY